MKKIGFVDYYIGEWHSHNYPAWIVEACEKLGVDYRLAYVWAEIDKSPRYDETTAQYCEKYGAEACATVDELCEKSDVIVILAPSDPEKHLGYAEAVLKHGKRTYIDKTFAPDLATAKKIFALGEKYGTPFFSSSALRYSTELVTDFDCRQMMVTGGGRSVEEYIVHQAEMVVAKLGLGIRSVRADRFAGQAYLHVEYDDDRAATMIYSDGLPFTVYMEDGKKGGAKPVFCPVKSDYFKCLIADMVRFFEEGTVSFDPAETLEVMKLREGALRALEQCGTTVCL